MRSCPSRIPLRARSMRWYDLLDEFENYIVAETILPVVHTLAGLPGTSISDIRTVYSKTEALMQTRRFLDDHSDWQKISVWEYGDRLRRKCCRIRTGPRRQCAALMLRRYTDYPSL